MAFTMGPVSVTSKRGTATVGFSGQASSSPSAVLCGDKGPYEKIISNSSVGVLKSEISLVHVETWSNMKSVYSDKRTDMRFCM